MESDQLAYSLNASESAKHIGISLRSFRKLVADDPTFPAAVCLGGPRSSRWIRTELEAYVASRPRVHREEPPQLAAARAAKAAGRQIAPAPFNGSPI